VATEGPRLTQLSGAVDPAGGVLDEGRRLGRLAWPIVLGQVGLVMMGLVDVIVCGWEGERTLAAVGAGRIWAFGVLLFGFGALRGIEPIFAQAWGAGERSRMAVSLAQTAAFVLVLSVPVVALHLVCGPALTLLGQPPEVIPDAAAYCDARAVGVPFALAYTGLAAWLQGQGRVRAPMVVVWVGNVVNLLLDLLLVGGIDLAGGLSIPAYGAVGCAWATTVVELVGAAFLAALCAAEVKAAARIPLRVVFDRSALVRMTRLGLPVGVQTSLEVWAFNAAGLLVGTLGAASLAAHVIAMQIISLTFMVPFGVGGAASARVGNLVGAGQPWGTAGVAAVVIGAGWMLLSSVTLVVFGGPILGAFTSERAVLAVALTLLPVAALFQVADGVQAVAFGVLRGAGDTRVPALANVVAYWLVGIPCGWFWGIHRGEGAGGVWLGLAVGLVLVALLMLVRMKMVAARPVRRV